MLSGVRTSPAIRKMTCETATPTSTDAGTQPSGTTNTTTTRAASPQPRDTSAGPSRIRTRASWASSTAAVAATSRIAVPRPVAAGGYHTTPATATTSAAGITQA